MGGVLAKVVSMVRSGCSLPVQRTACNSATVHRYLQHSLFRTLSDSLRLLVYHRGSLFLMSCCPDDLQAWLPLVSLTPRPTLLRPLHWEGSTQTRTPL
jgi:hypothetical protein